MSAFRVEALDRRHLGASDRADRCDTGSSGATVHMHSAGATHSNPATELGSRKANLLVDHPKKWHVIWTTHRNGMAIEIECGHDRIAPGFFLSVRCCRILAEGSHLVFQIGPGR